MIKKWKPAVQAATRLKQGVLAAPEAIYTKSGIRSYWGFKNFGDLMTPVILRNLGKVPMNSPTPNFAEFLGVGSILDSVKPRFSGYILGSGFLNAGAVKALPLAKVLGVRGKLTKNRLEITSDIPLGDLGLVFPDFCNYSLTGACHLGIIPHYSDSKLEPFNRLRHRLNDQVKFIDVLAPPEFVVDEIASCSHIVSSSLHGLVVADALGVKNSWVCVTSRQMFKYYDYYSSLDESVEPYKLTGNESEDELLKLTRSPPKMIEHLKAELHRALDIVVK